MYEDEGTTMNLLLWPVFVKRNLLHDVIIASPHRTVFRVGGRIHNLLGQVLRTVN